MKKIKLKNFTWNDLPVYEIPIEDLLGVRSSITTRKLPLYSNYVNKILESGVPETPVICFVAGDGMLRVKHGNLLYWVAKETHQETLNCVFPVGVERTDALLKNHMDDLGINGRYF